MTSLPSPPFSTSSPLPPIMTSLPFPPLAWMSALTLLSTTSVSLPLPRLNWVFSSCCLVMYWVLPLMSTLYRPSSPSRPSALEMWTLSLPLPVLIVLVGPMGGMDMMNS